jgi:hypothetical protein
MHRDALRAVVCLCCQGYYCFPAAVNSLRVDTGYRVANNLFISSVLLCVWSSVRTHVLKGRVFCHEATRGKNRDKKKDEFYDV